VVVPASKVSGKVRARVNVKAHPDVCFVRLGEEGRSDQLGISQCSTTNGPIAEVVGVAEEVSASARGSPLSWKSCSALGTRCQNVV
jgi:hypothetical protein